MDAVPETEQRCALCGELNQCGIAAGNTSCWCFTTPVPPALLERVPDVIPLAAVRLAIDARQARQIAVDLLDEGVPVGFTGHAA